jgi:hypothetical protein
MSDVRSPRHPLWAVCLSALLWPGAGQLYNRDRTKGIVLIVAAALAGLGFVYAAGAAVFDLAKADPEALVGDGARAAVEKILAGRGGMLGYCSTAIAIIWAVGVVDAFLGARKATAIGRSAGPRP